MLYLVVWETQPVSPPAEIMSVVAVEADDEVSAKTKAAEQIGIDVDKHDSLAVVELSNIEAGWTFTTKYVPRDNLA